MNIKYDNYLIKLIIFKCVAYIGVFNNKNLNYNFIKMHYCDLTDSDIIDFLKDKENLKQIENVKRVLNIFVIKDDAHRKRIYRVICLKG